MSLDLVTEHILRHVFFIAWFVGAMGMFCLFLQLVLVATKDMGRREP